MNFIKTSGLTWLLCLNLAGCGQASTSTLIASPIPESAIQPSIVSASPKAVILPSASSVVPASSMSSELTLEHQVAITDPSALLPLRPHDPACGEMPADFRDRRLVREVRTLKLGDTPEVVAKRVFARPTTPFTRHDLPGSENRAYIQWNFIHEGSRAEADLTFLDNRLKYVTAGILYGEGTPQERVCTWAYPAN